MTAIDPQTLAERVVIQMMGNDAFSQWLGIEVTDVAPGCATCTMDVRAEMVNGFGTSHGGVAYSLADSAFAFATNNCGRLSVAVDTTMSYPAAVRPGDRLTAVAVQESTSKRLAFCTVTVRNQLGAVVGHFRGTVYRTQVDHFPELGNTLGLPSTPV
ncbi:MAG: hotdog fold thioesterase [Gemmatimonadetes bacterium]|nr:hotdog fold thioesterase [Gemmatimonadota bacterium]